MKSKRANTINLAINVARKTGEGAWGIFDGNWERSGSHSMLAVLEGPALTLIIRRTTFQLSVGGDATSGQNFDFVPSTSSSSTWLPIPEGCSEAVLESLNATQQSPETCAIGRGVGLFQSTQSLGYTVQDGQNLHANYSLDLGMDLNPGNIYGAPYAYACATYLDHLYLEESPSGYSFSINKSSPIFGDASLQYFLPIFGLGFNKWVADNTSSLSFLESLAEEGVIPTRSWGYTAGASYKYGHLENYHGSLVLGGYDEARIQPHTTAIFEMPVGSGESELALTVQQISVQVKGTYSNYSEAFDAILESTLPYLFLPVKLCNWFQEMFNLTYDSERNLYLVDQTVAEANYEKTQSITFALGNQSGQPMTKISFYNYQAFSALASWKWQLPGGQLIFPMQRMPNGSTKAVLGRAFFQEAYVSVHYRYNGTGTFTVSQVAYPSPETTRIISIMDGTEANSSKSLSTGKIAAIAVGAFVGIVLICLLYWLLFRKRLVRKRKEALALEKPNHADEAVERPPADRRGTASSILSEQTIAASEIDGTSRPKHSRRPSELSADSEVQRPENKLGPLHEEPDKSDAAQLARYQEIARAGQVPRQEMEASTDWTYPDRRNARTPTSPSELYSTPELPASPVSPELASQHSQEMTSYPFQTT